MIPMPLSTMMVMVNWWWWWWWWWFFQRSPKCRSVRTTHAAADYQEFTAPHSAYTPSNTTLSNTAQWLILHHRPTLFHTAQDCPTWLSHILHTPSPPHCHTPHCPILASITALHLSCKVPHCFKHHTDFPTFCMYKIPHCSKLCPTF